MRPAERPAVEYEPDDAVYEEHARRAPGHADGVPSPELAGAGGRGLRGVPDPARDDGGRGRPARTRRDQHDVVRLAGDGAGWRSDHAHVADRTRDEGDAGSTSRSEEH